MSDDHNRTDPVTKYTLSKRMRISSQKDIDSLFSQGDSFIAYPLRVVFLPVEKIPQSDCSILVSVPKKRLKKAVKRNKVKRLVRESFRLQQNRITHFVHRKTYSLRIAFVYISDSLPSYLDIKHAMDKSLEKLQQRLIHTNKYNEIRI